MMYNRIMKNYQDMLKDILKTSGWSQQQLATRLGVSFPTVNYWLNSKVTPRKNMQKRIKDLYLARDIPYEGPVYITLLLNGSSVKVGDEILLFKTPEDGWDGYEVVGIKREDFLEPAPDPMPANYDVSIPVANTKDTVAKGTKPALRIYDRVHAGAYARVMFIFKDSAIAVVEDFGLEMH